MFLHYLFNSIATCLPFTKTSVTATITSIIFHLSSLLVSFLTLSIRERDNSTIEVHDVEITLL